MMGGRVDRFSSFPMIDTTHKLLRVQNNRKISGSNNHQFNTTMKNGIFIEASLFNEVGEIISQWHNLLKKANDQVGEMVSQSTAFRQFGRRRVERLIREGKLTPIRQVRRVYFYLWDIEDAANVGPRVDAGRLAAKLKGIQPAM